MSMKTILFLLDGVGDRAHASLGGQTPLQAASCPNLDRIAKAGETGLMMPLSPGIPLGTDHAHYLLFGYGPQEYPGRAVIDAIGEGLGLSPGDLVLRTSWATVQPFEATFPRKGYDRFLIKERFTPGLSRFEVDQLMEVLPVEQDGIEVEWHFSHDSHGFLVLRDCGWVPMVSDTDPFYEDQHVMCCTPFETDDPSALSLSEWVNRYLLKVHHLLSEHEVNNQRRTLGLPEANFMLTKWAGRQELPEPFHLRNGMRGAIVASSKLLRGVAKSLEMDYYECECYEEAVRLAHGLDYDYVHVHTKAPDTAAHTKIPLEKVRVLESLDAAFSGIQCREDCLYIVTGDHSTASSGILIHSGESVPVVFLGAMTRRDLGNAFNEVDCGLGGLRITAADLMPMILNFTDRAKLYHLRAGSRRRPYRAANVALLGDA